MIAMEGGETGWYRQHPSYRKGVAEMGVSASVSKPAGKLAEASSA